MAKGKANNTKKIIEILFLFIIIFWKIITKIILFVEMPPLSWGE
jgi:hypothetical protein